MSNKPLDADRLEARPRGRPRSSSSADATPEPVKGLNTGLAVLRALAAERRATLTNVALSADTTPPTTYRMLTTLQRHGFAEFDERTQEWAVGVEAFRVGASFLARSGLVDLARATMVGLMLDTHETANLGVGRGVDVVFLAQVEARHPIRAFHESGSRERMHASGIGKTLLAQMDAQALETFVRMSGLPRFTDRTVTDACALAQHLADIRLRGWSLDDEERHVGMRCVAAPIFDATGVAVAGVSVSGPSMRLPDAELDQVGARVRLAAAAISARLGAESS